MGSTADAPGDGMPRSFVFSRGTVAKPLLDIVANMRQVVAPFTYNKLKARRSNVLKDFISVSGMLGVTHFVVFTSPGEGSYMRIMKVPHGPTLTFRIREYSTVADLAAELALAAPPVSAFAQPPLCILSGFASAAVLRDNPALAKALALTSTTLKAMLPEIDVTATSRGTIKRCVLFAVDASGCVLFRHYAIRPLEAHVDAGLFSVLRRRRLDMADLESIGDVLANTETVDRVALTEIGPRLSLQLVKVEAGISDGMVLYHAFNRRTDAEVALNESRSKKARVRREKADRQVMRHTIQRRRQERMKGERRAAAHAKAQEDLHDYAALKRAEASDYSSDDERPAHPGRKTSAGASTRTPTRVPAKPRSK